LVVDPLHVGWVARRPRRDDKEGKQSPIIAIAILLICIGVFAFSAVLLRLV
jgi:hypothetical protein